MPAAVPSRTTRQSAATAKSAQPPAKKAKLSETKRTTRQNGLEAIISGKGDASQRLAAVTNGEKDRRKTNVDESRATVAAPDNGDVDMQDVADKEVVEISSGEEQSSDYESDDDDAAVQKQLNGTTQTAEPTTEDAVMADGDDNNAAEQQEEGAEAGANDEPTFGDMLRANAPEVIDVEAAFTDAAAETKALAPTDGNRALSVPSATSLGTVLTQALRTNDKDLLESCFQMNDLDSVRSTIERLHSSLVANLLARLAERLHKRPGRAGNLMVWVQWSLVSHGGYLASQPEVVKKLGSLNCVIKERASGLEPLLSLKGKLDMLSAQMELRRGLQRATTTGEQDEDAVIYVEGQESEDEDEEEPQAIEAGAKGGKKGAFEDIYDEEDSEEEDDMPNTVAGMDDDAEESDEESEEDEEGLLDDEAEETENDTGDDFSEAEDDEDEGEDLSESETEARPAKRSTAATRSAFKRR